VLNLSRTCYDPPFNCDEIGSYAEVSGEGIVPRLPTINNDKESAMRHMIFPAISAAVLGMVMTGQVSAFNPQPDPPGKQSGKKPTNPGAIKGFNPQPDPPGKQAPAQKGTAQ
jgi:hypothetical protein